MRNLAIGPRVMGRVCASFISYLSLNAGECFGTLMGLYQTPKQPETFSTSIHLLLTTVVIAAGFQQAATLTVH